jgi:hypothetical protein
MAKDKPQEGDGSKAAGRDAENAAKIVAPDDAAGGQHHAAAAHGEPAQVDTTLPATRAELLVLHAAARQRRNSAELGSDAHRAAVTDLERIEIRVAAIERAQDPPLG